MIKTTNTKNAFEVAIFLFLEYSFYICIQLENSIIDYYEYVFNKQHPI